MVGLVGVCRAELKHFVVVCWCFLGCWVLCVIGVNLVVVALFVFCLGCVASELLVNVWFRSWLVVFYISCRCLLVVVFGVS